MSETDYSAGFLKGLSCSTVADTLSSTICQECCKVACWVLLSSCPLCKLLAVFNDSYAETQVNRIRRWKSCRKRW